MVVETNLEIEIGGFSFPASRPHRFGVCIDSAAAELDGLDAKNYLHRILLNEKNRAAFLDLIDREGLVVCKNLQIEDDTYRKVRGKSSSGRLSQAEYYHHDGCSCPTKPRVNEIRLPFQSISRNVATAIAPFRDVVGAQLMALPERLILDAEIEEYRKVFSVADAPLSELPDVQLWDRIQGRVTRLVRRDLDAESSREYFRTVDRLAMAYDLPWENGESRLMLNAHDDLTRTMQHRRAFQKPKLAGEKNGSLVKRWTAEEFTRI